jgi:hypothetical protein
MKFLLPYVLIFMTFITFLCCVFYFTPGYDLDDLKYEAFYILSRLLLIASFLLPYYIMYRFYQKPMLWIFSRLQMIKDEDEVNQSFGLFALYSYLATLLLGFLISVIAIIAFFWYYSLGVFTILFLILYDVDLKRKIYLKRALLLLLISLLFALYPYRDILLHVKY